MTGGFILLGMNGCKSDFPVLESELLDKTKVQIINIIFAKSEKNSFGKYQISINSENGSHQMLFFDSKKEAIESQKLLLSDQWGCFYLDSHFKINGEVRYYKINFEKNKSVKVQICKYSEF